MNAWFEVLRMFILMTFVSMVVLEGALSSKERTFHPGQYRKGFIKLPFVFHGGVVIGDLVLLPYAFYQWLPQMQISPWQLVGFFVAALWITWAAHRAWWFMCEKQPGFMYPDRSRSLGYSSIWYLDLPPSAWIHFVYMVGAIVMIGGYIVSPMSTEVVWTTFWIFVVFIPLAIIEPGIVQGWPLTRKDIFTSFGVAVALLAVVGVVTWVKLAHWFGF